MIPFLITMIFVCSLICYIVGYFRGNNDGWKGAKEMYSEEGYDEVFELNDLD